MMKLRMARSGMAHVDECAANAHDVLAVGSNRVVGAPLAREELALQCALTHHVLGGESSLERQPCSAAIALSNVAQDPQRGLLAAQREDVKHSRVGLRIRVLVADNVDQLVEAQKCA